MNNQIIFRFQDGTKVDFSFDAPSNAEDRDEIAQYIIDMLARRKALVSGEFGKLVKKSDVISHRKLSIDFFINGKLVDTLLSGVVISNKICTNAKALANAIQALFMA